MSSSTGGRFAALQARRWAGVVMAGCLLLGFGWNGVALGAELRVSEIFYQPATTNLLEEWFELANVSSNAVDLSGWKVSRGVAFEFPVGTSVPGGGLLVVAADRAVFAERHPGVGRVVGGWTGTLSDDGETIEIQDAAGKVQASAAYAPDGDFAVRRLAAPDFANRRGWEWYAGHAGRGRSLERRRFDWPAEEGQNWESSEADGGTPGSVNAAVMVDAPPLVLGVRHAPWIPQPTDTVSITCRVLVDGFASAAGATARVHWRRDGDTDFTTVTMQDDGTHGDGVAGDGTLGAVLPPQPRGTVVEWYVTATDAAGRERRVPRVESDVPARTGNRVYQVDDPGPAGAQPVLRLVLLHAEWDYLSTEIWGKRPDSDALVDGTFIATDGINEGDGSVHGRYGCGFRNRGHGTRSTVPHNVHVAFPKSNPWRGRSSLNLNTYHVQSQHFGSAFYRSLGMPAAESRPVQVRWNGANLAKSGFEQFGAYAANEPINDRLAATQFPDDPGGNLYRGVRDMLPGIRADADLKWLGAAPTNYALAYAKENHVARNDWSDFVHLVDVLNNTPDADYERSVRSVIRVEQWMRYFAISILLGNQENSLANGAGDDFAMYRGLNDTRFAVIPYDMDSLLGRGSRAVTYADGIWRMTNVPAMHRLITHPAFAPIYLRELKELATGAFAPRNLDPLIDQWLGGYVEAQALVNMKAFATSQVAHVLAQIPSALTADHGLPLVGGVLQSSSPVLVLHGQADAVRTRAVRVQDETAAWTAWTGSWTHPGIALKRGNNRVRISAIGERGESVGELVLEVAYDEGGVVSAPASVASDVTWSPGDGPRLIAGDLAVQGAGVLRIQAGTTVYLGPGAGITVGPAAQILFEGTPEAPVRLTRAPGSATAWGGIVIQGGVGSPESRLVNVIFEGNGDTAVHVDGGTAWMDGLRFRANDHQYVSVDDASFFITNCEFPSGTAGFELVHGTGGIKAGGRGVIYRNYFGIPIGYNDVIDFTGGNRPARELLHVIDNVFTGATDDILDLDGTDAWVEGNVFMHVHKNGSPDSASAVSGGSDGSRTSEVTVIGNLFYDCDQAATAKQGNFYTLIRNTIVRQTRVGGLDTEAGVLNFADDGTTEGAGMYLAGNIIADIESLTRNLTAAKVILDDNLLPVDWTGQGSGNSRSAPRFRHVPKFEETLAFRNWSEAQVMREWFSLQPGSGGRAAGAAGEDWGPSFRMGIETYLVETRVTQSGEAVWRVGPWLGDPTLTGLGYPAGSGYTHYRYSVDGGVWSEERPSTELLRVGGMAPGVHHLAVVGRRDTGWYEDDAIFRPLGAVIPQVTWEVSTGAVLRASPSIRFSEVLAAGRGVLSDGTVEPDQIEVENFGTQPVDLSGTGLSDSMEVPYRFAFPPGTRLEPGARRVLVADGLGDAAAGHLGFGLKRTGGLLRWVSREADGSVEWDRVEYGPQLEGRSIGRAPDGTWVLCEPTFGGKNRTLPTGEVSGLRINEWLADAQFQAVGDFVELLNPGDLPVDLGEARFSDAPGSLDRHRFPPLSFVDAHGTLVLKADGDAAQGGDHLTFKLSPEGGQLRLADAAGIQVDAVVYGPQTTDVSEGRSPDGSVTIATFPVPTPGSPNPGTRLDQCERVTETIALLPWTAVWRYDQTQNLDGVPWTQPGFDDGAWPEGPGLLAVEDCACLPAPGIGTPLNIGRMTYYFRTRFDIPTNLAGFGIQISAVLDDGMVVYVNGTRVLTQGIATDSPAYTTTASRNVGNGSLERFTLASDAWVPGPTVIAVEVHQANTTSTDVTFGLQIEATRTTTNCAPTEGSSVRLHEVLASVSGELPGAAARDYVELLNRGVAAANLDGMSLTDDTAVPRKWVFPAGTILGPGGLQVLTCDDGLPLSTTNTGFGLSAEGGAVYLFDSLERGGGLVDAVRYGLQVTDASLSRTAESEATWTLGEPTPGALNRLLVLGAPSDLRVNEWLADASEGGDWFELRNRGANPVALGGLGLTDTPSVAASAESIAPLSFIGAGVRGYARFHADGNASAGANHVAFSLRKSGEALGLLAPGGAVLDAVSFGPQITDRSEGRFPDGADVIVGFASPSPGRANWLPAPGAVIHEVLAHTDSPREDALEVWNPTDRPVSLAGWFLSNTDDNLRKYRVPDGTVVPPGGYWVVYENDLRGGAVPFTWNSAHGDAVILSQADAAGALTGHRAEVRFGPSDNGVSMGRVATSTGSDFVALERTTFGADQATTLEAFRLGRGLPNAGARMGPVVISEFRYQGPAGIVDDSEAEFIELLNTSAAPTPLFHPEQTMNTWRLRGGVDFQFPPGVTLAPGAVVLVVGFDPANRVVMDRFRTQWNVPATAVVLGPWTGRLDNAGERIALERPDTVQGAGHPDAGFVPYVLVEGISYRPESPWPSVAVSHGESLSRADARAYGNDPAHWTIGAPTPGWVGSAPETDTDSDGMPDAWEREYLGGLGAGPAEDADGDGLSNLDEYRAGTNPADGASVLRLGATLLADSLRLAWVAAPGRAYTVQFRDAWAEGTWQVLTEVPSSPSGGPVSVVDVPETGRARYYRVVLRTTR